MPMMHGSQGCTSFGVVLLVRHFKEAIPLQTTAMNEVTTILGGYDNLEKALLNIRSRAKPAIIAHLLHRPDRDQGRRRRRLHPHGAAEAPGAGRHRDRLRLHARLRRRVPGRLGARRCRCWCRTLPAQRGREARAPGQRAARLPPDAGRPRRAARASSRPSACSRCSCPTCRARSTATSPSSGWARRIGGTPLAELRTLGARGAHAGHRRADAPGRAGAGSSAAACPSRCSTGSPA